MAFAIESPSPVPPVLPGARAIGAGEALEQLVAQGGIDARAVIVHAQHRIRPVGGDA